MFYIPVFIYICVVIFVLIHSLRRNAAKDFLCPQKRFGPWSTALSVWSTGESGWWALGLTGLGYAVGLQSLWFVFGETIFAFIMWYFIAPRFYKKCETYKTNTVGDFFANSFHDNNITVRMIVMVILFCIVPLYLSAQYAGLSRVTEYFSFEHRELIFIIFSMLFVFYSIIGGFHTMSSLSVFHGALMGAIICIMAVSLVYTMTTHHVSFSTRILDNDFFWNIWGNNGVGRKNILIAISQFMVGIGFLGAPNMFAKFLNAKNFDVIKKAAPIGVTLFGFGDVMAAGIGIMGRLFMAGLPDNEMVIPVISTQILPGILTGVVFIGVIAAIFSTADSLLLLISSWFVKDVYRNVLNIKVSNLHYNNIARGLMLASAVAGLLISFADNRLVFWMVNFVWVIVSCTFAPLVVIACFHDAIDSFTAIGSILTGLLTATIWNMFYVNKTGSSGVIPGLVCSFASILVIYRWRKYRENIA